MKKIYLVDSENVGDVWVPLLVSSQPEDEVFVFYTLKSPHMGYENVRMLKETEREATFVKCFEGNNALDFQLVTQLGYMLNENDDCEYVIVSNDTGFDAAVRYWASKKMPVSRLSGKECSKQISKPKPKAAPKDIETKETPDAKEILEPKESSEEKEIIEIPEEETDQKSDASNMAKALCNCISKDNLVDYHNALVMLFGEEDGKRCYQEAKANPECIANWASASEKSQEEKFGIYCKIVFDRSEYSSEYPEDFSDFLYKSNGKRKNLNSLRAALQGHYGKDKGMKYYSLFKSHIKIMNRM